MIRRTRDSTQQGYALLIVLGLMGLTTAVITALLSLSLTTSHVEVSLSRDAEQRRAADGALEAAVAQLRGRGAGGSADPCDPAPLSATSSVAFDNGNADGSDDVIVRLTCEARPTAVAGGAQAEEPGGQVALVGTTYRGGVDWADNCTPDQQPPGCFPWKLALGVGRFASGGGEIPGLDPTLVHTGGEPLPFAAAVTVRGRAAAVIDPARGEPAIVASDQFVQGRTGPFATQAGNPCGILSPSAPTWRTPAASVSDADRAPTCDDAAAKLLRPPPASQGPPFTVDPATPTTVPASCPAGDLVTLDPGVYDTTDTARLNRLLDGTCPNRTFWFQPGTYSFDVDDTNGGANRNALTFADASAKVVFGAPKGWSPPGTPDASDFPLACDPAVSGASVALTARTAIHHSAGRVAVCPVLKAPDPAQPSAPPAAQPALAQTGVVPPELEATGASSPDWSSPSAVLEPATRGLSSSASFSCTAGPLGGWCDTARKTFSTTWRTSGTDALRALRVSLSGGPTVVNPDVRRYIEFRVQAGDPAASTCTARFRYVPELRPTSTVSYDLLGVPACASVLTREHQLDGARIDTSVWYSIPCILTNCQTQDLGLTGMELLTDPIEAAPGTAVSNGSDWTDGSSVSAPDSAAAAIACTPFSYFSAEQRNCGTTTSRTLTLGGFADRSGAGAAADDAVDSVRVLVRYRPAARLLAGNLLCDTCGDPVPTSTDTTTGKVWTVRTPQSGWQTGGSTTFQVTSPGGTCSRTFADTLFVGTDTDVTYDLSASPDCARVLQTAGLVSQATVTMTQVVPCIESSAGCRTQPLSRVDYVSLLGVLQRGTRTNSWLTADAGNGASFHAAGAAILPNTDLDLRWRGMVAAVPLFRTQLVLDALGSDMAPGAQVGTPCCSPLLQPVRLQACIDGTRWGEALVRTGPVPATGGPRPVTVLDWDVEGGSSACDPLPPALPTARGG